MDSSNGNRFVCFEIVMIENGVQSMDSQLAVMSGDAISFDYRESKLKVGKRTKRQGLAGCEEDIVTCSQRGW